MYKIYLDDVRTPTEQGWIVVRNYQEFCDKVESIGLDNIEIISLDHDLGPSAMQEYFVNVSRNYQLDYTHINEQTGYDCAKWLVEHFIERNPIPNQKFKFPQIYTHSANPIGSANIMGYINNFLMNSRKPQTCVRVHIPHIVD